MEWINEKAKTLSQGAIRAMFDRANKMTDVISLGIGEPDMTTPKEICDAAKQALDLGYTHYTPNAGLPVLRKAIAEKSYIKGLHYNSRPSVAQLCCTGQILQWYCGSRTYRHSA